jgi:hypothetical protein
MATKCYSSVRSCAARITKLDSCGRPVPPGTECGYVVTKGYTEIAFTPETTEPDEIEQRNACGEVCVTDRSCEELRWINVAITFCQVDPDVISLITGYERVLDWEGNSVGVRVRRQIECDAGWALETWSRVPDVQCEPTAAQGQWGYYLLPWLVGGIIGEYTLGNNAVTFSLTARTKAGSGWGVGPWDVDQQDAAGTPGPLLTPIGPDDHEDMHLTTIAPPEPECGCQPMPDYSLGDVS